MRKILHNSAFTLIELILSTLLVTLILLGIFSISNVLNNNNQDYGQRYLVRSETQATLNHILNNAALAQGSANANDEGILLGATCPGAAANTLGCATDAVNNPNSFCIHQPGGAGNNLINNGADIWLCYTWTNDQIYWCAETYSGPGADPRGASSCTYAAANGKTIAWQGNATTYLGTEAGYVPLHLPIITAAVQLLFSISINNCLNDITPATCNGNGAVPGSTPGTSSDPANNPEVTVTGSVIPTQESM